MESPKALAALLVVSTASWLAARSVNAHSIYDYNGYCEQHLTYTFRAPPAALAYPANTQFFRGLNYEMCLYAQSSLTAYIDSMITHTEDLYEPFYPSSCSPVKLQFSGAFVSTERAKLYKTATANGARKVATEYICKVVRNAYGFNIRSDENSCFPLNVNVSCSPPPVPFPRAKCNKAPGTTRVAVAPNVTQEPGRSNDTTLYCFNITAVQPNTTVPQSNCTSNKLARVEIYADDSKRDLVTGLRVTRNGSKPVWGPAVWGPARANSLKVGAPLLSNWNMTEAIGGQICVETLYKTDLHDICLGGAYPSNSACYLSLFNERDYCCPTYPVELPDKEFDYYYYAQGRG